MNRTVHMTISPTRVKTEVMHPIDLTDLTAKTINNSNNYNIQIKIRMIVTFLPLINKEMMDHEIEMDEKDKEDRDKDRTVMIVIGMKTIIIMKINHITPLHVNVNCSILKVIKW